MNIFERNEFWALIGVIIGYVLTELTRFIRTFKEKRNLRKALFDELEINYFLLEHKKDTLTNILNAIEKKEVLSGISVNAARAVYESHTSSIILLLEPIERDLIQNIYSRLEIIDTYLDNFENEIITAIKDNIANDPWAVYKSRSSDMKDNCEIIQEYIKSALDKVPLDIYERKSEIPIEERSFAGVVTPELVRKQRGA